MGVAAKRTRLSPAPAGAEEATGMLDTAIRSAGTVTSRVKVALRFGSSQEGTKRRASEFSNWVKSARFLPPPTDLGAS